MYIIQDIEERLLYEIANVGGTAHDQHSFMATSRAMYSQAKRWREREFALEGSKLILPPYIVELKKSPIEKNMAMSKDMGDERWKIAITIALQKFRALNEKIVGVAILVEPNLINMFAKFLREYGLLDDDPVKSNVIFMSYNVRKHYDYAQKLLTTQTPFTGKICVLSDGVRRKWQRNKNYGHESAIYWINMADINLYFAHEIQILGGVKGASFIKVADNIPPIMNVSYVRAFTPDGLREAILGHVEKYGSTYVLSPRDYTFVNYGNLVDVDDEFVEIAANEPTLYIRKEKYNGIIPLTSIIFIIDSYTHHADESILKKASSVERTLNITCIYPKVYIACRAMWTDLASKFNNGRAKSIRSSLTEIYSMFKFFGYDMFEFGEYEKYLITMDIRSHKIDQHMAKWQTMSDNKLTYEQMRMFIDYMANIQ